uniref:Microphthalmia-associated transcription factor n=1 Tax=Sinohyriopsis cumingii TaxID=165450 RepID=A0A481S0K9_SINCU|nr:microphthalmia-associated transcription factor [Sinohyriopsis cumingii]
MQDSGIDSGIDIDFNALLPDDSFSDGSFYTLKSKIIVGSPQTDIKHVNVSTRTNLKQQLMRQHAQNEDKRQQEACHIQKVYQQSQGINVPLSSTPPTSCELPHQVLQVTTKLENPTKYHIVQNQKRQIEMFISSSVPKGTTIHSLPVRNTSMSNEIAHVCGSAPDPDRCESSPLSLEPSSAATSVSEVESFLNELGMLDTVDSNLDDDLSLIEPSLAHMSSTLPQSNYQVFEPVQVSGKTSMSAPTVLPGQRIRTPPYMNDEEARSWAKERQKKDNHNMIERRRRFNINDRIKELGTLLPKTIDPDLRQNKGSILKASVDYIRRLKKDQDKLRHVEEKQRAMEASNRKLMLRMQQLELVLKAQGFSIGEENNTALTTMVQPDILTVSQPVIKQEEMRDPCLLTPGHSTSYMSFDDFMDDSSPLSSDPLMSDLPDMDEDQIDGL